MTKKRMLLRDLLTRLAQSEPGEIYVEVEELEPDVFVLPLSFPFGFPDSSGVIDRIVQSGGLLWTTPARGDLPGITLNLLQGDAITGNAPITIGASPDVWELRSVTLESAAGGNYAVLDDGVRIGEVTAVGAGAIGELITVPLPVAGGTSLTIENGLIGDAYNIRAVLV